MIDLYKYSKKNRFYNYLINNLFGVKTELLSKPFFYSGNIKLDIKKNFFYDYKKKFPITKWIDMNNREHYQSNHDLQKLNIFKQSISLIENFLNQKIKNNLLGFSFIGKFKVKSLWFTIQKKNEGHQSHNHPKSILSGVYYFSIDEDKGGEIEILMDGQTICHKPKVNDIIIFHSDTYHSVKPYHGKNDRIALVWDAVYSF
tara:strand:+ start:1244 stop:1846 length:603 start_codon:yes stop_codon:yes gene_type:complete